MLYLKYNAAKPSRYKPEGGFCIAPLSAAFALLSVFEAPVIFTYPNGEGPLDSASQLDYHRHLRVEPI